MMTTERFFMFTNKVVCATVHYVLYGYICVGIPVHGTRHAFEKETQAWRSGLKEYNWTTLFKKNIFVYALGPVQVDQDEKAEDEEDEHTAKLIYRSNGQYEDTVYLNLYENNFSYICDMSKYSQSYQRARCGKFLGFQLNRTGFQLNRYEKTCEGTVVHKFSGGVYRPAPSLFEQLEEQGIEVPERLKCYPYWATYDIEAMLVSQQDLKNTDKLQWTQKHVTASVSAPAEASTTHNKQ